MITIISRRRWQQLTAENKRMRDELTAHRDMLKELEKKIRRMEGSIDTMKKTLKAERKRQRKNNK